MILNELSSNANIVDSEKLVTTEYVKKAVDEYNQDPLKVLVRNSCQLDKAILVGACLHIKASGDLTLHFDLLWERLQDFLIAVDNMTSIGNISEIDLLLPPYEVFEMAVERLIRRGVFKRAATTRLAYVPRHVLYPLLLDLIFQ